MQRLLLIDAYAMIYRAYYAFIRNPRINSKGLNTSAIFGFVITLEDLMKRADPSHVGVAFDPKGKTFRHEAFEQYKAQREETPEDIRVAIPYIKDILSAMNIPILEVAGFEADDVIGTLAKQAEKEGFDVLMATPDKDYGQLVSNHIHMYRPRHSGGFENMGPEEVCAKYGIERQEQVIDLLGLMGDSSDNIPGCTGVGEKTAVKLLQEFGSIDNLLAHTDQLKGALRQKIETQAEQIRFSKFLATIRTDVPIQFDASALLKKETDIARLQPVFIELEFRSLLKRYSNGNETTATAAPDLFSQTETPKQPVATKPSATTQTLDLFSGVEEMQPLTPMNTSIATGVPTVSAGQQLAIAVQGEEIYLATTPEAVYHSPINSEVKALLEDAAIEKTGFDLKQVIRMLTHYDIALRGKLFDSAVCHYLIQPDLAHDIDYLSEIYLHQSTGKAIDKRLAATLQLYPILRQDLQKAGVEQLFTNIEMPLVEVLASMEEAGVRFDKNVLKEDSVLMTAQLSRLEEEIQAMAGQPFNINSPKQVGDILFGVLRLDPKAKKTKNGQYVTSEEILISLTDTHPIVRKILDYRAKKKLLSTYIDALPELINPQTGKIHTTYNQTVAVTGRLSSSNPNLQNLPIRSEEGKVIRRAVIPDEGCLFLSADYSQIELRLMAHFSQDEHLLTAFKEGQDIHAATAAKIFGVPIEKVDKDMRRKAKTANFGIIYGISAFGLSQQLGASRQEAKQLIDDYFAAFPGVIQFIEQAKEKARKTGYVETLFGRKRYLPDINSHNSVVRGFAERNAVNAPIQGTAADIIKIAMVRIYKALQKAHLQTQMIMQVHDELNFNVPANEVEQVREIVVREMQSAVQLTVPLIAECGIGENWLEAH